MAPNNRIPSLDSLDPVVPFHHPATSTLCLPSRSTHYEKEGSKLFNTYFHFVERHGKYIFAIWCLLYVFALIVGPEFLTLGDDSVKTPPGTKSWHAQQEFEFRFKDQSHELPLLVMMRTDKQSPVLVTHSRVLEQFALDFIHEVLHYNDTTGKGNVLQIMSYFTFKNTLLDGAKSQFVSSDQRATFMNVVVSRDRITAERYDFVKHITHYIHQHNPDSHTFHIGVTGFDALGLDSSSETAAQVAKTDMFTMPIALGLLGVMIRSWRLLIFSSFNLGLAILLSFAIMAMAVKNGAPHPESASAQLMEVMTMAVSIDWSLFLHRRFRDEIKKGADARMAAYFALLHSGHVVIMSGGTLVVVFLFFLPLPAATVSMDGACCAVGVSVAMLVALSNTPAVWLTFPQFCSDFDPKCCKKKTLEDLDREAALLPPRNGHHDQLRRPLLSDEEEDEEEEQIQKPPTHVMYDGVRFKVTRWVTKYPNNVLIILLLYVLVIPLAIQLKDMVIDQNVLITMPRSAPSVHVYKEAFEYFGGGFFSPFYVMVTTKSRTDKNKVLTPSFFDMVRSIASEVATKSKAHDDRFIPSSVTAPVWLNGVPMYDREAEALLITAASPTCNTKYVAPGVNRKACSVAKEYEFEYNRAVNEEGNSMLITITVPFFPFAQESSQYIDLIYTILDEAQVKYPNHDFYLCGFEVGFNALMHRVFSLFPQLIGGTFIIVFILLGTLLRSAFVPFRLILTLIGPLAAVFGSAVLVYQKGWLKWTGLAAFGQMDGFFWYIPILLMSMIIGLALDWDVLLISRIMEHRENGYDVRAAICKATCETGGTISAAGIIMCLAFGGMLFSDSLTMNVCGFILTEALILDTFVVNTLLVPALVSVGDKVAWWPAQMPMENLKTLSCGEFPVED